MTFPQRNYDVFDFRVQKRIPDTLSFQKISIFAILTSKLRIYKVMINDMSYNLGGISVSLLELFFHLIAGHHFPRLNDRCSVIGQSSVSEA